MVKERNTVIQLHKEESLNSYGKAIVYKMICVIIGFLNSILINRSLGVALRGEYTTIINWASLLQLFFNLGIGTTYPAFKRKYPNESKTLFTTISWIIALTYLVFIIFAFPFIEKEIQFILLLAYITTLENILIVIAIVEDVIKRNLTNIITMILHMLVLLFVCCSLPYNLEAIIWAVILDHAILCITFIILYKLNKINIKLLNINLIKSLLKTAIPAMLMNMLMYMNYHADILFLSQMTNSKIEIGLYGTAVTLGNILWIIPDAFKDILYNRAAKKDNPKEILLAIICNFILCIIVLCGFIFLGKWFLKTMYGADFIAAYPIVLMLFIGTLPMILYKLIHPIYIANGNMKIVVILLALAVIANIFGNIILIPQYNAIGAAISSVISYSICGIAFFIKFKSDYKISFFKSIKPIFSYKK